MIAADFTAAIPEPYQILGLRLLPLSVGRYRLLHRFNCAFVSEEATTATIGDLILGILICSMRFDQFVAFYESKSFAREVRRWANRIGATPPWFMRNKWVKLSPIGKHWRKNHSFNFVEKMQLFKNYVNEAQAIPEYAPTHPSTQNSTAHWSSSVEIVLRSELNWQLEEINEEPLTKALSDYFKHLEFQGLVKIFTPEDLEMGRANAAALEAFEKLGVTL
jgi:hypothetical protein